MTSLLQVVRPGAAQLLPPGSDLLLAAQLWAGDIRRLAARALPWLATLEGDTAYQVRAVVPEIGHAIHALRAPAVSNTLVYGAPALVAGWLILSIWRPRKQEEDRA